ncbi:MAG: flavodoxin [Thermoguttaceae bacterium]|nr:flavodoxin [Thermoguttaceae bacterium]
MMYGNTQYLAHLIQRVTGGELFLIQTEARYPADYDATVTQGDKEGKAKARPKLASHIENIADYEIVFLGFPNWWYDMPMALYTFLEEYDLSGKTVIPFSTSGGSGFSDTVSSIQSQEPKAKVVTNGLTVLDSNVANSKFEDIDKWVKSLGLSF